MCIRDSTTDDPDGIMASTMEGFAYGCGDALLAVSYTHLDKQNVKLLGKLATTSALLNNKRLPKPYLEEIIEITTELGLLGVNVAHSGSIVGILLTQDQLIHLNKLEERLSQHPLASYYSIRNLSKIIYDGLKVKKVEEICG